MIGTHLPDGRGRFGDFGGRFVPETVMAALDELEAAVDEAFADPAFHAERDALARDFVGRPTPLYLAERLTEDVGGAQIWLKREDLNHTGAHKINNAVGQALIARRLGKRRIVAETGAGQHGVATATVCARFGLDAVVYMGAEDIRRQRPNVVRMGMLGAELVSVDGRRRDAQGRDERGDPRLDRDRRDDALHDRLGRRPAPLPVPRARAAGRDRRRGAGAAARPHRPAAGRRRRLRRRRLERDRPVPPVPRRRRADRRRRGRRRRRRRCTPPRLGGGRVSILHGSRSYVLADENGQVKETHSISAGLDYPGVGPEHAHLKETGRAEYVPETDEDALRAFHRLCRLEGIIPALESSHALARAERLARELGPDGIVLVGLSGRGDKDVDTIAAREGTS